MQTTARQIKNVVYDLAETMAFNSIAATNAAIDLLSYFVEPELFEVVVAAAQARARQLPDTQLTRDSWYVLDDEGRMFWTPPDQRVGDDE